GDLMVKERKNFQRIYDLTERVLPSWVDTSTPDMGDVGRFLIHRALNAHGLARAKEIRDHIHLAEKNTIEAVLRDMVETEEVLSVKMENTDNMEYYLLPGTLEKTGARKKTNMRLELLSPFDNLVIQRDRLKRIFDFDYQLECYVPSKKRKYGYFMLPVLWGNEFVAKLDPKAKRASNLLLVKKLLFEPGFKDYDAILSPLSILLRQYALFNNLDGIKVEKTVPVFFKNMLQKSLR
ncbi:winged helix-turn-helix domain-containing protein, partial [bacterium]|nr:winged helix-turn-helix domain-containing protein [bacterium]